MATPGRVAIVGAGPCGLACARELDRLGHDDWVVYERGEQAGGHAGSVVDPAGFTWDQGGHVVFSHFGEFDRLLEEVMGADVVEHERASFVRYGDRWVPYPFQNNLRHLPPEAAYECLLGLVEARDRPPAADFAGWLQSTFGAGINEHFLRPYNEKVWAVPLERMSADWIAERVSVVDYRRALRNVVLGLDDVGWGPNNRFKFPLAGGTGEIYRRLAARLGGRIEYRREVVGVDPGRRRLHFRGGEAADYDALVSTMPLDRLAGAIADAPGRVAAAARALEHSSVRVVGAGYEQPLAESERCWMYFPAADVPFYRVTNFAKYAAANVPGADTGRYSSFMTEVAYSRFRPLEEDGLGERVTAALVAAGLADATAPLASLHSLDVEYAYPVPTLDRDRALAAIQPWLEERGIYSRGRFGSWRYELGNMDHAVKMGIDAARLIVEGRPEELH